MSIMKNIFDPKKEYFEDARPASSFEEEEWIQETLLLPLPIWQQQLLKESHPLDP